MVWTCRGKKVYQLNKDPFFQFLWRPKPPTVLPKEPLEQLQQAAYFKKHYQKKYKQMEKVEQDAVSTKRKNEQDKLKNDYQELILRRLKEQDVCRCLFDSLIVIVNCIVLYCLCSCLRVFFSMLIVRMMRTGASLLESATMRRPTFTL
jgi:hypothetical protein